MKRFLFFFLLAICILGAMSGCSGKRYSNLSDSSCIVTGVENVSATVSDLSPTGATVIITDQNKEPYTYGEWYQIEKEENGKWYKLKTMVEEYGFNDLGYLVNEHNQVKFVIDWEWLYGKLPQGRYRILKQVGQQVISIPFNITTPLS